MRVKRWNDCPLCKSKVIDDPDNPKMIRCSNPNCTWQGKKEQKVVRKGVELKGGEEDVAEWL